MLDLTEPSVTGMSMTCLQLIICYGLKFNFRIRKIDFVVAYLNGELTDVDIYMALLPGFEDRYRQSPRSACISRRRSTDPSNPAPNGSQRTRSHACGEKSLHRRAAMLLPYP